MRATARGAERVSSHRRLVTCCRGFIHSRASRPLGRHRRRRRRRRRRRLCLISSIAREQRLTGRPRGGKCYRCTAAPRAGMRPASRSGRGTGSSSTRRAGVNVSVRRWRLDGPPVAGSPSYAALIASRATVGRRMRVAAWCAFDNATEAAKLPVPSPVGEHPAFRHGQESKLKVEFRAPALRQPFHRWRTGRHRMQGHECGRAHPRAGKQILPPKPDPRNSSV
jgi:hypothetical protein